jgi:UDP-N-acetylmuramoylalanine--D-glutamate ligase
VSDAKNMIAVTTSAGRRVAVFGLGASGAATVRALMAGGADVAAWDDVAASRDAATKAGLPLVDLASADWSTFASLVLAPGVPLTHPKPHWTVEKARAAGVEVIGDIELFLRERAARCPSAPLVAITGTNGKSTTTALTAHILRAAGRDVQMGGNIGRAVLTLEPPGPDRIHVIEMSSFQIDLTTDDFLKPTIAALLNLTPDHLDRHGTMAEYAAVKERLVVGAQTALIGLDDGSMRADDPCAGVYARLEAAGQTPLAFTRRRAQRPAMIWFEDGGLHRRDGSGRREVLAEMGGIDTLRGAHNGENAAAAFAICERLGVARDIIAEAMRTYPGLPHRMEEVGRAGRVLFINDSKATNADSTEKALASWSRDIYWILGGKPKEGGITTLAAYFPRVARAYLIGQASEEFAATLEGKVGYERCTTLDVALARAADDAARSSGAEPVVLLSPACASYDQFKSFEHRGDVFREMVARLPHVMTRPKGAV